MTREIRPLRADDLQRLLDAAERGESLSPEHTIALLDSHVYWRQTTARLSNLLHNARDAFEDAVSEWCRHIADAPQPRLT